MRLRQIVWNLASNAVKFGAGAPIDVTVDGNDRAAELRVRDRGPGIPEPEQGRVFGRFERAGSGRPHVGFGVGLWVVKRVVDAMGGAVRLESTIGEGTTFTVILPRRRHD